MLGGGGGELYIIEVGSCLDSSTYLTVVLSLIVQLCLDSNIRCYQIPLTLNTGIIY